MGILIRVRKALGKISALVKIERNTNVANQIPLHVELVSPPRTKAAILIVTGKAMDFYTLHLTGDTEATKKMNEQLAILDTYYYETATYVEKIANDLNDSDLPIEMGMKLYAKRKTPDPKMLSAKDGVHPNELVITYPKVAKAAAYRSELAIVVEGEAPNFKHFWSSSTTTMTGPNAPSDTKLLIRLWAIFADSEIIIGEPIPFHTKEW